MCRPLVSGRSSTVAGESVSCRGMSVGHTLAFMKRLTSAAFLVALVGCAPAHTESLHSVTITQRPTYAICAGYCPDVDVVIRDDGRVTVSQHSLDEPEQIRHLQVGSERAARAILTLRRHLPPPYADPGQCSSWNTDDEGVLKVYQFQITWSAPDGRTDELRSCGGVEDRHVREAIRTALDSIGLYMGGEPRA